MDFSSDQLRYFPPESRGLLEKICETVKCKFIIRSKRFSKLGDFNYPVPDKLPVITVNSDLKPSYFLVIFLHELAHYLVWVNYSRKIKPHGKEWKSVYSSLLLQFIDANSFPENLIGPLKAHALNPKASSYSDVELIRAFREKNSDPHLKHLNELAENQRFQLENGRMFKKGKKKRSRILCREISSNRIYLIHGMAEVKVLG